MYLSAGIRPEPGITRPTGAVLYVGGGYLLEILDIQLRVSGHPLLDDQAQAGINEIQSFQSLAQNIRSRPLKDLYIGPTYLMAFHIGDAAVMINRQWGVSIHADKLLQCVYAMLVLWSEVEAALGSRVVIEMPGRAGPDGLSLPDAVAREERRERWTNRLRRGILFVAALATIAALTVALVSLTIRLVGG